MDLKEKTRELVNFINTYIGYTVNQLSQELHFETKAKNKNALLIKRIETSYLGANTFETLSELNHLLTKTIQLENGKVQESMSFSMFDYKEIINISWEESEFRKLLSSLFLFCVFEKDDVSNKFIGAFLWKMPEEDLDGEAKRVWEETKEIIKSGNIVKENGKRMVLNFPKEKDSPVCHVRPHGRNGSDMSTLPVTEINTYFLGLPKQSFWLNKAYIEKVIKEHDFSLR